LDAVDPDKKKQLEDGGDRSDIWHDSDDGNDGRL